MLQNVPFERVAQERPNAAVLGIVLHDREDSCVLYACVLFDVFQALVVDDIQVDNMDTLRDPILSAVRFAPPVDQVSVGTQRFELLGVEVILLMVLDLHRIEGYFSKSVFERWQIFLFFIAWHLYVL